MEKKIRKSHTLLQTYRLWTLEESVLHSESQVLRTGLRDWCLRRYCWKVEVFCGKCLGKCYLQRGGNSKGVSYTWWRSSHFFVQEKGVLRFVCCTVTLVLSALRITKSGLALSHLSLPQSNLGADFCEILFHTRLPRLSKWCVLSMEQSASSPFPSLLIQVMWRPLVQKFPTVKSPLFKWIQHLYLKWMWTKMH